jgi:hypothetical protein
MEPPSSRSARRGPGAHSFPQFPEEERSERGAASGDAGGGQELVGGGAGAAVRRRTVVVAAAHPGRQVRSLPLHASWW